MSVDTLSIARELRAAEIAAPQAEAIASVIGRALVDSAASKTDLESVEHRFTTSLESLEHRLTAKLESFRSSMLVWFIGTQVAVGALIVALVKL